MIFLLLSAIRTTYGACTSNTLGLSGAKMCDVCLTFNTDSSFYQSQVVLGNFDSVFTNSDPDNCPVTSCGAYNSCNVNSGITSSVLIVGNAANNFQVKWKASSNQHASNVCFICFTDGGTYNIMKTPSATSGWGCAGECAMTGGSIADQ